MFVIKVNNCIYLGVEKDDLENLLNDVGFVGGEVGADDGPFPETSQRTVAFFAKDEQEFKVRVEHFLRGECACIKDFHLGTGGAWN